MRHNSSNIQAENKKTHTRQNTIKQNECKDYNNTVYIYTKIGGSQNVVILHTYIHLPVHHLILSVPLWVYILDTKLQQTPIFISEHLKSRM